MISRLTRYWTHLTGQFKSKDYWEDRYRRGGNSGAGSYDRLAEFKAGVLNALIVSDNIKSVVEFGCGDGHQLSLLQCDRYIGLDVSGQAIELCKKAFAGDAAKSFFLYDGKSFVDNHQVFRNDCSISLDVLFHLIERDVYDLYLEHLFKSASRIVIIYAADVDMPQQAYHVLYRKFTRDIAAAIKGWKLDEVIKNKYPSAEHGHEAGSAADFYIYRPV